MALLHYAKIQYVTQTIAATLPSGGDYEVDTQPVATPPVRGVGEHQDPVKGEGEHQVDEVARNQSVATLPVRGEDDEVVTQPIATPTVRRVGEH